MSKIVLEGLTFYMDEIIRYGSMILAYIHPTLPQGT